MDSGARAVSLGSLCAEIRAEWDLAEEHMKLAESVEAEAQIPSINELRYAGRRLIDALIAGERNPEGEEFRAKLDEARFFCHRARHDAIDAATALITIQVNSMIKHLGYEVVVAGFARIPELRSDLHKVRGKIAKSRGKRESRDAIYETISSVDFPEIVELHAELMLSEPLIRASARRKRRFEFFNWLVGIVGIVSLLITVYVEFVAKHWPSLAP